MIMSIDFQFLYDNPFSLPYISYKMKYGSISLDVFHQISLFITSSFSFVFAIWKWEEEESIHPPLYKSLAPSCADLIRYFKPSCDKHINSVPAVPGMSVPVKIFICLRYRDCLESWTQFNSPGTAGRLSAVPGTSVPIKTNLPGTCPR